MEIKEQNQQQSPKAGAAMRRKGGRTTETDKCGLKRVGQENGSNGDGHSRKGWCSPHVKAANGCGKSPLPWDSWAGLVPRVCCLVKLPPAPGTVVLPSPHLQQTCRAMFCKTGSTIPPALRKRVNQSHQNPTRLPPLGKKGCESSRS